MTGTATWPPRRPIAAALLLGSALATGALACGSAGAGAGGGAVCGDGKVEGGETCDTGAPAADAAACPTSCGAGADACHPLALQGAGTCTAQCAVQPITACLSGDGCCPAGCTPATDGDCAAGPAQAVQQTVAGNPYCTALTPFYWEIGDAAGALASGQGGTGGGPVDPSAPMGIASASKLIFGAYALQARTLAEIEAVPLGAGGLDATAYLNFTSGYHSLSDLVCDVTLTVGGCFTGGGDDTQTAADVGRFYYNGGHLQAYGVNVADLGPDYRSTVAYTPQLAVDIQAQLGDVGLTYTTPGLAGGGKVSPGGYAFFLRQILSGALRIRDHLGEHAVCAWTNHPDCDALYSPVNESSPGATTNDVSDFKWHYSLAHWVEDDGTFSSPGAFGFYPWIDSSRTYYGIVARYDTNVSASPPPYFASVACGRMIRTAWMTGVAQ